MYFSFFFLHYLIQISSVFSDINVKEPFPLVVFKKELFFSIEKTTIGMQLSLAIEMAEESITFKLSESTFFMKYFHT